jgi:hypothetical protein
MFPLAQVSGCAYVHARLRGPLRTRKNKKARRHIMTSPDEEDLNAEVVRLGLPLQMKIGRACDEIGIGVSKGYELLGDGELEAVKSGKNLLVKTFSVLRYIRRLPAAKIAPSLRAAKRRDTASGAAPR